MKRLFKIYLIIAVFINFFSLKIRSEDSPSIYFSTIFSALVSSFLVEQIKNIGVSKDNNFKMYEEKIMWKKCLCDYRDLVIYDEAFGSFFKGITKEALEKIIKEKFTKESEKIFNSYFKIFSAINGIFRERRLLLKSIIDMPKKAVLFLALFGVVKGCLSLWINKQIKYFADSNKNYSNFSNLFLNFSAVALNDVFIDPLSNLFSLLVCFNVRGNRVLYNLEGDRKAADKIIDNSNRCFNISYELLNVLK